MQVLKRLRHGLCAALAAGLLVLAAAPAPAAPVRTEHVEIDLLAEQNAAVPGQQLTVALAQRIIPHWHTYWLNPGESGLPTEITWTLPEGWTAGAIQWPVPQRLPVGPLMNYGYEDQAILLVDLTAPAGAKLGQAVHLKAEASWLVCEEICVPESAVLTLDLPVAAASQPAVAAAATFRAARAAQPQPSPFAASFRHSAATAELSLALPDAEQAKITEAYFYAEDQDTAEASAVQSMALDRDGLHVAFKPAKSTPPAAPVRGILQLTELVNGEPQMHAFAIAADLAAGAPVARAPQAAPAGVDSTTTIAQAIFLALLGGLILNLMPCVFPVLSMKALALVSHRGDHARMHGLSYAAGVLVTFALIGGALLAVRASGALVGWGFQLQNPLIVAALSYVLFALGLSMSGVFEVTGSFTGMGQSLAARGGAAGSFFTGALAVVVATPCTAPFMGVALGFALVQPPVVALAIFLALGLGLALPFLLLTLSPALLHLLPRPGAWMDRLKQVLAFPLYGSAAWLVWVLSIQAGPDAVAAVLAGLVLVGFAAWLYGTTRQGAGSWRLTGSSLAAVALVAAFGLASLPAAMPSPSGSAPATAQAGEAYEKFSEARVQELTGAGKPVFVNLTAAWCITCLVNERVALSTDPVKNAFAARGVTYLKGDWTNRDAEISTVLTRFGRSGVPLYVLYAPGRAPQILPQILTPGIMLDALDALPLKQANAN